MMLYGWISGDTREEKRFLQWYFYFNTEDSRIFWFLHPGKWTAGMNLKITQLKSGKSSNEPSTHPWLWVQNVTPPETNIAPKNGWLEYTFSIGIAYFQGALAVRLAYLKLWRNAFQRVCLDADDCMTRSLPQLSRSTPSTRFRGWPSRSSVVMAVAFARTSAAKPATVQRTWGRPAGTCRRIVAGDAGQENEASWG